MSRHEDASQAPPPLQQPFEIAFPDSLPRRAPGLAAVLLEREASLMECGMTSTSQGHWRQNQCLYLSLAAAAGATPGSFHTVANDLRSTIEGAVRRKKPNWADRDFLGQEVGAFADFLLWGMQDTPLLRDRAVAVYDARAGTCEIFRSLAAAASPAPVLALWFSGSHYRWVRWSPPAPSWRWVCLDKGSDPVQRPGEAWPAVRLAWSTVHHTIDFSWGLPSIKTINSVACKRCQ